jgi:RND superfamily putative drug exporter
MFETWGRSLYRARRLTLVAALLFAVAAGVWGTGVFSRLNSGDTFTPPNSQSSAEAALAASSFGRDGADVVVLFRSTAHTVSDPVYRQAVTSYLAGLPAGQVTGAVTYWTSGQQNLVSADKYSTYAVLRLAGDSDQARQDTYKAIKGDFPGRAGPPGDGITAEIGGGTPTGVAINQEVSANIARAESISFPVLLILLVIIFGSVLAALAPLMIGGLAILGSFTVLRLLTTFTTVSVYSVNITTILGLGLGIDYGLFIVTRFREELRRQPTVEAAVARTVATAGRTVLVSGVTVALALSSLILFQPVFLRSMGYGGVATVAVDVIAALTVLPALLAVLGHRINALAVRKSVRAGAATRDESEGGWYRLARRVMRRPVAFAAVIVIVLLALGTPFLRASWGGTDARVLPATNSVRQVQQALTTDFTANSTTPIEAVVTGVTSPAALASYTSRIDAIPGVTGVRVTGEHGTAVRLDVGYRPQPDSP